MSGPLPLALALVAVLALIGLSRVLGFNRSGALGGADHATALVQNLPGGFAPHDILFAQDSRGALLRDIRGRVALVAPMGAHFLVREAEPGWQVLQGNAGRLIIRGSDFTVDINPGIAAASWLAILAGLPAGNP